MTSHRSRSSERGSIDAHFDVQQRNGNDCGGRHETGLLSRQAPGHFPNYVMHLCFRTVTLLTDGHVRVRTGFLIDVY